LVSSFVGQVPLIEQGGRQLDSIQQAGDLRSLQGRNPVDPLLGAEILDHPTPLQQTAAIFD